MQKSNDQKRLYYLRRYNRLYQDQIHSLEQQLEKLKQTEKDLRQENEQLRNEIYFEKTNAIEQEDHSKIMQEEFHLIKNELKKIKENQEEHLIGVIHRPYKESTYSNGLGKEINIEMNEDNKRERTFNELQNDVNPMEEINIDAESLEEIPEEIKSQSKEVMNDQFENKQNDSVSLEELRKQMTALQEKLNTFEQRGEVPAEEEFAVEGLEDETEVEEKAEELTDDPSKQKKKSSAIVQQIKDYGSKKERTVEQPSEAEVYQQTERKERLRFSNLTFRDIQRASQIYSKPNRNMGRTRSSVNRHMNYEAQPHTSEQEESNVQKASNNHKKPEIIQQPEEIVKEEVQEDEKKSNKNVEWKEEKDEVKDDVKAISEKEQVEPTEETSMPSEQLSNEMSPPSEAAKHPKEEQTPAEKQEMNNQSSEESSTHTKPSPEQSQTASSNEDVTPSSDQESKDFTTKEPHEVNKRTIQPHQSGKGTYVENRHQPSFFKSLLNRFK